MQSILGTGVPQDQSSPGNAVSCISWPLQVSAGSGLFLFVFAVEGLEGPREDLCPGGVFLPSKSLESRR